MLTQKELANVGNSNGRDVECLGCGEYWENLYILEDFTASQFNKYAVLDSQLDDPGGEETRIAELNKCPDCDGAR